MIIFDPAKRDKTLLERGLDFRDAAKIFEGLTVNRVDDRQDYGEERWITAGYLDDRFVVIVWTQRGPARRVISMRHGHDYEEAEWF